MIRDIYKRILRHGLAFLSVVGVVFICAGVSPVYSKNELPTQVQADLLQQKIITAVKHNQLKTVVAEIEQYKKLGVAMPPAFLLVEAEAQHRLDDSVKAFSTLQSFLSVADRDSRGYREGIALYPDYQRDAQEIANRNAAASAAHSLAEAKGEYQHQHFRKAFATLQAAIKQAPQGRTVRTEAKALIEQYQASAQQQQRAEQEATQERMIALLRQNVTRAGADVLRLRNELLESPPPPGVYNPKTDSESRAMMQAQDYAQNALFQACYRLSTVTHPQDPVVASNNCFRKWFK